MRVKIKPTQTTINTAREQKEEALANSRRSENNILGTKAIKYEAQTQM